MNNSHNLPLLLVGNIGDQDDDCACPDRAFVLAMESASDLDNDCACPDKAFTLQVSSAGSAVYAQMPGSYTTSLPHGFYLAFSPYALAGPGVLNEAAWRRWQQFAQPQPLTAEIDTHLATQHLIYPSGSLPKPAAQSPETLTAWLHITNACNLDCPYCYVRKSSARMNESIGLQAVEAIFCTAQQNGFRRVKIKYAGGEATLHFKLVRRLHERAIQLAAETGLNLKEVVLSNGVQLRPEDADWLVENGVKLMISLDGVGDLHNQLRPQKNGRSSFDQVAHTLDTILLPRGLRPDITMTITGVNAHGTADVARWALIERGLPTSFNFYRPNNLSASRQELALEEAAIIEGMLAAYTVIETNLPTQPFLDGLLDRVQAQAHTHTCGVGQSYVVISHTGQLAQCQMHLESPVSPNLDGNLILQVANGPLQNITVDQKEGCRSCVYRYRCSGGCPLETYRATGRWDVQSPNCHIYQTLYPAALRLEGLRLMKVHGVLN